MEAKSLLSTVCKLQTQESWLCSLKTWELESQWCRRQSRSEGPGPGALRARNDGCPSSCNQTANSTSLHLVLAFSFYSGPQGIGWGQSTESTTNLSWKQPYRHIQKFCLTNHLSEHPIAPSSWHIKLTITVSIWCHRKWFTVYLQRIGQPPTCQNVSSFSLTLIPHLKFSPTNYPTFHILRR